MATNARLGYLFNTRRKDAMNKCRMGWIVSLMSLVCLTFALDCNAQSLPEGKGKAEFQRICSGCHTVSVATGQRLTHDEWAGVVSDMSSRGAQGTSEEFDNIVNYLSANFGPDNPQASNSAPSQAAAPAPVTAITQVPLTAEEASKAMGLIQANGCLSCHRVGEEGSYLGPDLNGVGAGHSPEQIRAALVSPNKEVLAENRTVQLVTGDGKTVTGRLLNQDGTSVQIIDSSSQLRSFEKSTLRQFTIVTTNPMSSYADKLSAQDLTDLVHYLSSLKGVQ